MQQLHMHAINKAGNTSIMQISNFANLQHDFVLNQQINAERAFVCVPDF